MNRRGLGKGLSALIPGADTEPAQPALHAEATTSVVAQQEQVALTLMLPIAAIFPNPNQPRRQFDEADLLELAESIKNHGILQPIVVRKSGEGYELIAGERRWRAAQRAGLAEIPVLVKTSDDRESLELALIENLQREDINPMDAAQAYHRLSKDFGLTQEQIAQRLGKSRPAIANTLRLLDLPEEAQTALSQGRITEGHARALLSLGDPGLMRTICKEITTRNLTVRDVESIAKKRSAGKPAGKKSRVGVKGVDAHLVAVEDQLRQWYQTSVSIVPAKTGEGAELKGAFHIEYFSHDEFERILGKLLGEPSGGVPSG